MSNALMNLYVKFQGLKTGRRGSGSGRVCLVGCLDRTRVRLWRQQCSHRNQYCIHQHQLFACVARGGMRCRESRPGSMTARQALRGSASTSHATPREREAGAEVPQPDRFLPFAFAVILRFMVTRRVRAAESCGEITAIVP